MKKNRKRSILSWICMVSLLLGLLVGCQKEVREQTPEKNVVVIYDVEPQGREHMGADSTARMEFLQQQVASSELESEVKANRMEELKDMEEVPFRRHEVRIHLFTALSSPNNAKEAPYYDQIKWAEESSGVEIDYIMLGSWEELRQELDKNQNDGNTKMVLFNNTYDKSLLKEAASGRYADMERALDDLGFYEEDLYDQTVLAGGRVEGEQVLVPLLYNVSGMVHGEAMKYDWKEEKYIIPDDIVTSEPGFEEFLSMLNTEMTGSTDELGKLPFFSGAFLDGAEPDLFLEAAGTEWEDYENQEQLFEMLYEYQRLYQQTQEETREGKMALQELWAQFLNEVEYEEYRSSEEDFNFISAEKILQLQLGDLSDWIAMYAGRAEENAIPFYKVIEGLMDQTTYFVETTGADRIGYHSVIGLLDYARYYTAGMYKSDGLERINSGKMGYWPIGTLKEADSYAAQPVSYAAVVDGGSTELAAKVIKALTELKTGAEFGFSVNRQAREEQLKNWCSATMGYLHREVEKDQGLNILKETTGQGYWNDGRMYSVPMLEDKAAWAEQLREQLDNVVICQIPDRELLTIWQDTVTEAVDTGVTAEAGFDLLCERMDEWYD